MTRSRLPLGQAFGTPDTKRRYTRRLFATIADRYDLITRVLSFGRDQAWKRDLIARAGIRPGSRVLDLACGTGVVSPRTFRWLEQLAAVGLRGGSRCYGRQIED